MLLFPQKGSNRIITNGGIVGSATPGTGLPSHATTLLDGAVTELITSGANDQDSWGIYIHISATGLVATASQACADILIGGATDDVLIPALICGYSTTGAGVGGGGHNYFFPVHIPGGKRVAATLASVRTSITARILIYLIGGGTHPPWRVGSRVTTYGTQINNARGQAVTPAASGGTASVTEMTASSTYDHFAFMPGFQPATDTTITPSGWVNIGIGVGAATEERIGTWFQWKDTGENVTGWAPCFPAIRSVPSGTRLTLLASNSGANDAAYDGLIYAV
jgi:hypothetical protein